MRKVLMVLAALLSVGMVAQDADAAQRLGGGSSVGRQRSVTPPAARPPVQQAPAATPAAPAPQPSGMSKWLGPLAGLAIGAGLASMFMGNGMGGAFGSILMMLALAAAVIFAIRMFRSKPQTDRLQYAGAATPPPSGPASVPSSGPRPTDFSTGFGNATAAAPVADRFPPGFDAAQFEHHAKLNFTRLQAANDKGDLTTMRDFMTPGLLAQIESDLKARGDAAQQTDVVTLNAEVVEVVTEDNLYIATVRFGGMLRERSDVPAQPFSELWHLEKPVNGSSGWLISGIQQE